MQLKKRFEIITHQQILIKFSRGRETNNIIYVYIYVCMYVCVYIYIYMCVCVML